MNGGKYFEYMLRVNAFYFEKGEKISLKKSKWVDETLG